MRVNLPWLLLRSLKFTHFSPHHLHVYISGIGNTGQSPLLARCSNAGTSLTVVYPSIRGLHLRLPVHIDGSTRKRAWILIPGITSVLVGKLTDGHLSMFFSLRLFSRPEYLQEIFSLIPGFCPTVCLLLRKGQAREALLALLSFASEEKPSRANKCCSLVWHVTSVGICRNYLITVLNLEWRISRNTYFQADIDHNRDLNHCCSHYIQNTTSMLLVLSMIISSKRLRAIVVFCNHAPVSSYPQAQGCFLGCPYRLEGLESLDVQRNYSRSGCMQIFSSFVRFWVQWRDSCSTSEVTCRAGTS